MKMLGKPVNKTASLVTNQSGCNDEKTRLALRLNELHNLRKALDAQLAGGGLKFKRREALKLSLKRVAREIQSINSVLRKMEPDGKKRKFKLCETKAEMFHKVAKQMLNKEVFGELTAVTNEYWKELNR